MDVISLVEAQQDRHPPHRLKPSRGTANSPCYTLCDALSFFCTAALFSSSVVTLALATRRWPREDIRVLELTLYVCQSVALVCLPVLYVMSQ